MQDLAQGHSEQLAMCMALERLADSLPRCADAAALRAAGEAVVPLMRRARARWLATRQAALPVGTAAALMGELRRQDEEDLAAAEEIRASLGEWREGQACLYAEALGYLLRGFVIARRRRVALERALLF